MYINHQKKNQIQHSNGFQPCLWPRFALTAAAAIAKSALYHCCRMPNYTIAENPVNEMIGRKSCYFRQSSISFLSSKPSSSSCAATPSFRQIEQKRYIVCVRCTAIMIIGQFERRIESVESNSMSVTIRCSIYARICCRATIPIYLSIYCYYCM